MEAFRERLRTRKDESAPGPSKGLGRGTGDDVGVRQGRRVHAGRDQPCDMGHVDQQARVYAFGNSCHAFEVDGARIGGAAGDEQRRADLAGPGLDRVVVEQGALALHPVVMGVEPAPGEVRSGAVAQVPAGGKVKTQDPISGLQQHEEHRLVGLSPRVRLNIGVDRAEERLRALDGEALDDVDILAAAVEAVSGIAFERLVADLVSKRLAHRSAHHILRGDELDLGPLPARLAVERFAHRRVGVGQRTQSVGVVAGVPVQCRSAHRRSPAFRRSRLMRRSLIAWGVPSWKEPNHLSRGTSAVP